jgi:hypothetical protein
MRIKDALGLALLLTSFAYGAQAQGLRGAEGPAEVPPSSFTDSQYVDSRGCIFIRAGRSGIVRWVPRVTRSREQMCGYRPSTIAAPQPIAPTVVPQATAAVSPHSHHSQPMPQQRVIVQVQQPRAQFRGNFQRQGGASFRSAGGGQTACFGASVISQQYVNSNGSHVVRCGPQKVAPTATNSNAFQTRRGFYNTGSANTYAIQDPAARIVQVPGPQFAAPPGYQPVWTDGRLNPIRGIGTLEGQIRTQQVWTNTVPSRLVRRETNRNVTYRLPGQTYPYIKYQQQYQSNGYRYRD